MKRLIVMLILTAGVFFVRSAQAQSIVIANPNVKTAEVSKNEIKDVFTGTSPTFKDGARVTPVLLKGGSANEEFLTAFVGRDDGPFKAGWRSLVFSGQASMPKVLDSEAAMVDYVTHTPGAVGYISKATPHDGVKVLAVH